MAEYVAPLKDMQFVIEHLVGLDRIAALPGCGDIGADLVAQVLGEAGKFAAEVLSPLNRTGDITGCRLADGAVTTAPGWKGAYAQFVEAGWNALDGDPAYGGQGLPHLVAMPVQEMWNSANMAFCLCPMLTSGVVQALKRAGSDRQKATFLERLISGEWTGTMNLTESQAGSDLASIRTKAVPEGEHYRIQGTKIFITYGEHDLARNIIHLVLARTPDAPEGVKGISLFLVPKFLLNADGTPGARNDVRCVSIEHKMGIHGSPTAVLAYGDEGGAIGYLVGRENEGLRTMFIMMNHARLGVGLEGVAIAERAYQRAVEYARTRIQGRPIGARSGDRVTIVNHPDVRRMLMTMKSQIEAMRALAYSAAAALDVANHHPVPADRARGQALVDLLTPIVKGWCTEQAVEICSTGVQIHGGMGFIEETGAAQHYRDARITTIYEGTTGIQANDLIGRKVGAEQGATMKAVLEEVAGTERELAATADPDLTAIATGLARGRQSLAAATDWLVETYGKDPNAAAASAVPYLRLSGIVLGGWMMARAAGIARAQGAAGTGDAAFLDAKRHTARFYVDHVLPGATGLAHAVIHGASSALAIDEAAF
jgi:alkylation response protein AidB-like acyl-CoA dehydrogenase